MASPGESSTYSETAELIDNAEAEKAKPSSPAKTLGNWVVLLTSVTCSATSAACAQALGGVIPAFELNLWRYLAEFALVAPMNVIRLGMARPGKRQVVWLAVASVASCSFNTLYFTSTLYLPIGVASGMINGFLLLTISLVTLVMLGDCTKHVTLAVFLTVLGVVVLAQPDFIFPNTVPSIFKPVCHAEHYQTVRTELVNSTLHNDSVQVLQNVTRTEYKGLSQSDELVSYGLVLGSAVSISIQYVIVNKKLNDVFPLMLNFWVAGFGVIVSALLMAIFDDPTFPTSPECILLLVGHAFTMAITNITELMSVQVFQPTTVSIVYSTEVILTLTLQYTLLEAVNPGQRNAGEIMGAVLVVMGNLVTPSFHLYNHCSKRRDSVV